MCGRPSEFTRAKKRAKISTTTQELEEPEKRNGLSEPAPMELEQVNPEVSRPEGESFHDLLSTQSLLLSKMTAVLEGGKEPNLTLFPRYSGTEANVTPDMWLEEVYLLLPRDLPERKKLSCAVKLLTGEALRACTIALKGNPEGLTSQQELLAILFAQPFARPEPQKVYLNRLQSARLPAGRQPLHNLITWFENQLQGYQRTAKGTAESLPANLIVFWFKSALKGCRLYSELEKRECPTYQVAKQVALDLYADYGDSIFAKDSLGSEGSARAVATTPAGDFSTKTTPNSRAGRKQNRASSDTHAQEQLVDSQGNSGPRTTGTSPSTSKDFAPVYFRDRTGAKLSGKDRQACFKRRVCWYCKAGGHSATNCPAMPEAERKEFAAHAAQVQAKRGMQPKRNPHAAQPNPRHAARLNAMQAATTQATAMELDCKSSTRDTLPEPDLPVCSGAVGARRPERACRMPCAGPSGLPHKRPRPTAQDPCHRLGTEDGSPRVFVASGLGCMHVCHSANMRMPQGAVTGVVHATTHPTPHPLYDSTASNQPLEQVVGTLGDVACQLSSQHELAPTGHACANGTLGGTLGHESTQSPVESSSAESELSHPHESAMSQPSESPMTHHSVVVTHDALGIGVDALHMCTNLTPHDTAISHLADVTPCNASVLVRSDSDPLSNLPHLPTTPVKLGRKRIHEEANPPYVDSFKQKQQTEIVIRENDNQEFIGYNTKQAEALKEQNRRLSILEDKESEQTINHLLGLTSNPEPVWIHTSKMAARHWRDKSLKDQGRMILLPVYNWIQSKLGHTFTLDAAANDDGSNALCSRYCSPHRSFMNCPLHNEVVWINPPYKVEEALPFIDHFLAEYQQDTSNSCTICLPSWRQYDGYEPLISHFTKIHTFPTGYKLFAYPTIDNGRIEYKAGPPCRWPTNLWYLPADQSLSTLLTTHQQHPQQSSEDKLTEKLLFQFPCTILGHNTQVGIVKNILFDSGAKLHTIISDKLATYLGMKRTTSDLDVTLADGSTVQAKGQVQLLIRLKGLSLPLCAHVMELSDHYGLIVGEDFLEQYGCILDYGARTLTVKYNHKTVTLNCKKTDSKPNPSTEPKRFLNATQVRRAFRKAERCFLFVLKPEDTTESAAINGTEDKFDKVLPKDMIHREQVLQILRNHSTLFSDEMVAFKVFEKHRDVPIEVIPLQPNARVPLRPLFRYSPKELEEMKRQVTQLLELGYIDPSTSPYGAPVLFVLKKDGSLRMCIDYRALNQATISNAYPLPRIDDLLDQLSGSHYFTSLDLTAGYHQLPLCPSDIEKTAFRTPFGTYQYKVLPFGLKNAPSVFQRTMNKLLHKYIGKCVLVYLDDILIYSPTAELHLQHLTEILDLLQANKFFCKLKKCTFFAKELKYLGYIVNEQGIKPDPAKVEAILKWQPPKNIHELRQFLGMTNQFHRFIQGYATLTLPFNHLLSSKAGAWGEEVWTSELLQAFELLKKQLTEYPVLVLPDFKKPFVLIADASDFAMGAMLMQDGHPVAYISKAFHGPEKNYTQTEKELLAVVYAAKTWRCYLEGGLVTLVTDHCPNTFFSTQPILSRRQARWSETLSQLNHQWVYKAGKLNVADPLSRNPIFLGTLLASEKRRRGYWSSPEFSRPTSSRSTDLCWQDEASVSYLLAAANRQPGALELLRSAYAHDDYLNHHSANPDLHFSDGSWYCLGRLYVPTSCVSQILSMIHDSPIAGHTGVTKTLFAVQKRFWWPTWRRDVKQYVLSCHHCQINKTPRHKPHGLLQPLPVPESPWHTVTMDFIIALPLSQGCDTIMVVTDKLTKLVHFIPLKEKATASDVAKAYFQNVWLHHGFPAVWITDRDTKFTSAFWIELCKLTGTDHRLSTAWHPQTDGQTERVNQELEAYIRHYINPLQNNWHELLTCAEFAFNSAYHSAIDNTPFELSYGYLPKAFVDIAFDNPNPACANFVQNRQTALQLAKTSLECARQRYKLFADQSRSDITLQAGDRVLLSTKNLRFKSFGVLKFMPKFVGPYTIVRRISKTAYQLQLPASLKVHNVFHISLLRPYKEGSTKPIPPMPVEIEGEPEYTIETILAHRLKGHKRQYLIRWAGYGPDEDLWEPENNLTADYKIFNTKLQEYWLGQRPSDRKTAAVPPALLDPDLFEKVPVSKRIKI